MTIRNQIACQSDVAHSRSASRLGPKSTQFHRPWLKATVPLRPWLCLGKRFLSSRCLVTESGGVQV
jgi:hypothetical protein